DAARLEAGELDRAAGLGEERHVPAPGRHEAVHRLEESRLPRSIRADHRDDRATLHVDRHLVQDVLVAVAGRDVARGQDEVAHEAPAAEGPAPPRRPRYASITRSSR